MNNDCLIIAEIGINHNGNLNKAFKLIDMAKKSGADIVKFQTFKAKDIVTRGTSLASYQKKQLKKNITQYEMLKKLELNNKAFKHIKDYCIKKKIEFLSSPFSEKDLNFLIDLGIKRIKIPSGEMNNLPLLKVAAKSKLPIILSTGMASMKEINKVILFLKKNKVTKEKLTVLHCTTNYPTNLNQVNLNSMLSIKKKFNVNCGYSDHTDGILVPVIAVSVGAKIIEKHFTLNKNDIGPDHKSSLEYLDFKEMVSQIRSIKVIFGSPNKPISKVEKLNSKLVRKSIVAVVKIKKGEKFNKNNITLKRPGTGLSPLKWFDVIGTMAKKDYNPDDLIN
tara:strand:- start:522 stop:1526 length:1005 start_codon:yes stop_codon:yes gene_type:complete